MLLPGSAVWSLDQPVYPECTFRSYCTVIGQLLLSVTLTLSSPSQTVLNTMCGYGMQQLGESLTRQNIFTIGCLEKIIWWAKNNLLLVAGLSGGLLLLEVTQRCRKTRPLRPADGV